MPDNPTIELVHESVPIVVRAGREATPWADIVAPLKKSPGKSARLHPMEFATKQQAYGKVTTIRNRLTKDDSTSKWTINVRNNGGVYHLYITYMGEYEYEDASPDGDEE